MKKIIIFFLVLSLLLISIYIVINRETYLSFWFKNDKNGVNKNAVSWELEVVKPEREVLNPYSEITLISNNKLSLKSGAQVTLTEVGQDKNNKYYYIAKVENVTKGESARKLYLVDEYNQEKEIEVKFNRVLGYIPSGYDSIDGWPGASYILDGSDPLVLVDKEHRFFEDFEPTDVVNLNQVYGIYTLNDSTLRKDAATNLKRMWEDCGKATGDYVTIASGYRSWTEQFKIYSNNVDVYGEEETNTFSAKPGHSEHQTGLAVDFTNAEVGYKMDTAFANTAAGIWLLDNSYKYGFAPSYPKESQDTTGYFEPWQFRYIGVDAAKEHKDSGLTLNEWLKQK